MKLKFCCWSFEGLYYVGNQFGINIRVVKLTSPEHVERASDIFYLHKELRKTKHRRGDIRFYMTMGYEKFSFHLPMCAISFCPFCGVNLYDFYNKDEYAQEIEGETFDRADWLQKPD